VPHKGEVYDCRELITVKDQEIRSSNVGHASLFCLLMFIYFLSVWTVQRMNSVLVWFCHAWKTYFLLVIRAALLSLTLYCENSLPLDC